ncbi:MAG: hypothetical protein LBV32_02115 [Tannerellaceae bacterium]|nr:hypothetical protein [Tannerellaceae bacterium]
MYRKVEIKTFAISKENRAIHKVVSCIHKVVVIGREMKGCFGCAQQPFAGSF